MKCSGYSSVISQKRRVIEERITKLVAETGAKSENDEFEKEALGMGLMLPTSQNQTRERRKFWGRERDRS
jgi:hypothetical protein